MGLKEKIMNDYKQAMKDKNDIKKNILNYLISQLRYKRIELGRDLKEEEIISVIKKEIKSRKEAMDLYTSSWHEDMATQEKQALEVLEQYLPPMLDEQQTRELVKMYISKIWGSLTPKSRWKLIGLIMQEHRAEIDPQLLNKIIDEQLNLN